MRRTALFFLALFCLAWSSPALAAGTLHVTVTDHDGWGSAKCTLWAWDEADRDWRRVDEASTRDGVAEFSPEPGVYRLGVEYREGDPHQERMVENIVIHEGMLVDESLYFERGELRLTVSDHDGPGRAECRLMAWNDADRSWDQVRSRGADNGRVAFEAPPGVYQLRVVYTEGDSDQERILDGIEITDSGLVEREAYFERGRVEVTVTDHDGWGEARCALQVWNEASRDWDLVVRRSTRDGRVAFEVPPGVYAARVSYTESEPEQERSVEGIPVADGSDEQRALYFERGRLQLTVTDQDGWGRAKGVLHWWNEAEARWSVVDDATTRDGRLAFDMAPGFYRLVVRYLESDPPREVAMENIIMADRMFASRLLDFGGDPPPLVSCFGPIEVGDGDGWYEVGEQVLFRMAVEGADVNRVEFLANDELVGRSSSEGRFEPLLELEMPGELRFEVKAWDAAGTLETYAAVIPVSEQNDQSVVSEAAYVTSGDLLPGPGPMLCPVCGARYPQGTAVCPEDGAELVPALRDTQGALPQGEAWGNDAPGNDLAPEQVVEFGLGWINVFTTPQQECGQGMRRIGNNAAP